MLRLGQLALAALVSGALIGSLGTWGGYQWAGRKAAEREAELIAAHTAALASANERVRSQELEHAQQIRTLQADFAMRDAAARERDAVVIDNLRGGVERLRLEIASCDSSGLPDAAAPSGGVDEGPRRAELAPATAATLWRIASLGDSYARRLTALQDWASSAVELCNGRPEQ